MPEPRVDPLPSPAAKQALRRELLAARGHRAERGLPVGDGVAAALLEVGAAAGLWAGSRRVAAYLSIGVEPGTGAVLAALTAAGVDVLLPVTRSDWTLDWAAYQGDLALRPAAHGLREPTGDRLGADAIAGCDLVLVPALAVDGRGTRLGRGAGCYDRALALATGRCVAVVYDDELRAQPLPAEPHDRPVHGVLTERQLLWCSRD